MRSGFTMRLAISVSAGIALGLVVGQLIAFTGGDLKLAGLAATIISPIGAQIAMNLLLIRQARRDSIERCDGCGRPATTHDVEAVPLCDRCAADSDLAEGYGDA